VQWAYWKPSSIYWTIVMGLFKVMGKWCGGKRWWRKSTCWKSDWTATRRVFTGQNRRVRYTRRRESGLTGNAERERELDKAGTLGRLRLAAWIFIILIIWTQLFHCKLFFYFFTKIHDFFFSINRDLDHLIWTQKKKPSFSLS